eukprot:1142831-Pelagomonas_calceolata.AAC.2
MRKPVLKELEADRAITIIPGVKCWTCEVLTAFGGLQMSELHEQSVQNGVEPNGHNHKQVTYHRWFASPLNPASAETAPYKAPEYLNLQLGRHVQRNIYRLRLRTHTLGVESLLAARFDSAKLPPQAETSRLSSQTTWLKAKTQTKLNTPLCACLLIDQPAWTASKAFPPAAPAAAAAAATPQTKKLKTEGGFSCNFSTIGPLFLPSKASFLQVAKQGIYVCMTIWDRKELRGYSPGTLLTSASELYEGAAESKHTWCSRRSPGSGAS